MGEDTTVKTEVTETPTDVVATQEKTVESESDSNMDFDMVADALAYDPFDGKGEADSSSDGGKVDTTKSEPETQATAEPTEKTSKVKSEEKKESVAEVIPSVTEEPKEDPALALLRDQVKTLQATLTSINEVKPAAAGAEAETKDSLPTYQFNIPKELMSMLDSENGSDRQQGIGLLAQGVARTVHQTVMGEVGKIVQSQIPTMVQGMIAQQTQAQVIFQDFYDKFPALNKPELRELIVSTGQAVMTESGAKEWSSNLRDTIAQRVLAILGQKSAPAIPGVKPVVAVVSPYVSNAGGARPAAPVGKDAEIADIADTLFG